MTTNTIFSAMQKHEQVVFCNDPATGLQAIIAIHDTTLGPALGGCRMQPYDTVDEAIEDALRLAEGMTHKCAAANVDFGGGKAVIIGDPNRDKTPELFRAFGQFINSLGGRFYTGTDMGTTMDDFVQVHKETSFVTGLPQSYGGAGDSSVPTALGVKYSLEATIKEVFNSENLGDYRYAIQGLGKVGYKVAEHLLDAGAHIIVADISSTAVEAIKDYAKGTAGTVTDVAVDDIFAVQADIFVPCARGAILNDATIPQLQVKAVVGSANNQLLDGAKHSAQLAQRGILYAPDYVVNAGGLLQVADELYGTNAERVLTQTKHIYDTLMAIYAHAKENNETTEQAANRLCDARIEAGAKRNRFYTKHTQPKWHV